MLENGWKKSGLKSDAEAYFLFPAFDLISIAERLGNDDDAGIFSSNRKSADKIKTSETTSRGGMAKADKYIAIKAYVKKQLLEHYHHHSNKRAGELIAASCPCDLLEDKSCDSANPLIKNPPVRFAVWISEFRKEFK